jgi:hypothetical protein
MDVGKGMTDVEAKIIGGKTKGYRCDGCGQWFHWDQDSSWYGSELDLEQQHWDSLWFACSDECAAKKPADFPTHRHHRPRNP